MADWEDIVRKLLNKAENSATTEEERQTINDRVTYLMAKFSIEQSIINAKSDVEQKVITVTYPMTSAHADKRGWLLNSVSNTFGCKAILLHDKTIQVFGYANDQEKVFLLYNSLILQMATGLAKAQSNKPPREHGRTFNTAFIGAYVVTVGNRVTAAYKKARDESVTESTGTDLVLRDRKVAVMDAFHTAYPVLGGSAKVNLSGRSRSGASAGTYAARNANIGQTGLAGGRKAVSG